jgi:prepilin peptidase CpaA
MLALGIVSNLFFAAVFVFIVSWAIASDTRRLLIPNWIPLGLIAGFVLFVILGDKELPVLQHVGVAVLVFLVAFAAYAANWMAGGDVKLYAAVALWAGPTYILPLVLITGLAGLALALMVRSAGHYLKLNEGGAASAVLRLVPRWVRQGLIPYGVAIGAGALATVPAIFS